MFRAFSHSRLVPVDSKIPLTKIQTNSTRRASKALPAFGAKPRPDICATFPNTTREHPARVCSGALLLYNQQNERVK
jgi:hypothetical protein